MRRVSFWTTRPAFVWCWLQIKDENMVWPILAGSGEVAGSGEGLSFRSAQVTSVQLDLPLPFPVQTGEAKDEAQLWEEL